MHVSEFRGFERFCEGRLFMNAADRSICGICPVSHHLASSRRDAIVGLSCPPGPIAAS